MSLYDLYKQVRRDERHQYLTAASAKGIAEYRLVAHVQAQLEGRPALGYNELRDLCLGSHTTLPSAHPGVDHLLVTVEVDSDLNPLDVAKDCGEYTVSHLRYYEREFIGWGQSGRQDGEFTCTNSSGDVCRVELAADLRLSEFMKHAPRGMSRQGRYEYACRILDNWKSNIEKVLDDDIYNYCVRVAALDANDEEIAWDSLCGVEVEWMNDDSLDYLRDTITQMVDEVEAQIKDQAA